MSTEEGRWLEGLDERTERERRDADIAPEPFRATTEHLRMCRIRSTAREIRALDRWVPPEHRSPQMAEVIDNFVRLADEILYLAGDEVARARRHRYSECHIVDGVCTRHSANNPDCVAYRKTPVSSEGDR